MDVLKRGDVILVVASGDFGKPRPALVVQSNLFNVTHASVTVCPITSTLVDAPMFRIQLESTRANGLHKTSQVMVDKVQTLKRERFRQRVGVISGKDMDQVDSALRKWLELN